MARAHFSSKALAGLLCGACAVPTAIDCLDQTCPPPELGRPLWVRAAAGAGAWIGGIVGGAASIVFLPITWPLGELADDGLGEHAQSEFLLFPAMVCASVGHAALGGPADVVDFVFRRAWVGEQPILGYDFVPMPGLAVPRAPAAAPAGEPAGATAPPLRVVPESGAGGRKGA
jgi:hypothetical protein